MSCRAPARIGQFLGKPQTAIGTPATFVPAEDGIRLSGEISWEPIGEGRVDIEETERALPGGFDPVLGSYGERLTFRTPVFIASTGELTADHATVRLFRACGVGVTIAAGVATINALVGGCVGDTAGTRIPITLRWEQEGGLTTVWQDCLGSFTIIGENTGGILEIEWSFVCRIASRAKTTALTAGVLFPGQARMLTARNASLALGSTTNPTTLYSWTFAPGIESPEIPSQLAAAGIDLPFVYQSSPATFNLNTALEPDYTADSWGHFFSMATTGALAYACSGQASGVVLEIDAPRPFTSPQTLGVESGHRTDERELLLKPSGTTAAWTIKLTERAP